MPGPCSPDCKPVWTYIGWASALESKFDCSDYFHGTVYDLAAAQVVSAVASESVLEADLSEDPQCMLGQRVRMGFLLVQSATDPDDRTSGTVVRVPLVACSDYPLLRTVCCLCSAGYSHRPSYPIEV